MPEHTIVAHGPFYEGVFSFALTRVVFTQPGRVAVGHQLPLRARCRPHRRPL